MLHIAPKEMVDLNRDKETTYYFTTYFFLFFSISLIKCVPRRGFGSAVCVQRDRQIVHIVSQSADLNPFRGTAGMQIVKVSA